MIDYEVGRWGVGFLFSLRGSVFPKAICLAVPNAIIAFILHWALRMNDLAAESNFSLAGVGSIWGAFTTVLGFLIVFRNNQAYTRFWGGSGEVYQAMGQWVHAAGDVISFCSHDPGKYEEVRRFQHLFVRLMSLLFCAALQRAGELDDDRFDVIEYASLDKESLGYIVDAGVEERVEILSQWLNRLILDASNSGVIQIPSPILSRAFWELHQGKVEMQAGVRVLKDVPFPFAYAQILSGSLLAHWLLTPIMAAEVIESRIWCAFACFIVILAFWSLLYIALQIDNPVGDDLNDLPIQQMMRKFNESLILLLHPMAQNAPKFRIAPATSKIPMSARSWSSNGPPGKTPFSPRSWASDEDEDMPIFKPAPRGPANETSPLLGKVGP